MKSRKEIVVKGIYARKLLSIMTISLLLLASFSIFFVDDVKAAPGDPNTLSVVSDGNVTVNSNFYTLINTDYTFKL